MKAYSIKLVYSLAFFHECFVLSHSIYLLMRVLSWKNSLALLIYILVMSETPQFFLSQKPLHTTPILIDCEIILISLP